MEQPKQTTDNLHKFSRTEALDLINSARRPEHHGVIDRELLVPSDRDRGLGGLVTRGASIDTGTGRDPGLTIPDRTTQ